MLSDIIQPNNLIGIDFNSEKQCADHPATQIERSIPAFREPNLNDQFTQNGHVYELIRFYPNPSTVSEVAPEVMKTVEVLTATGNLPITARLTARSDKLMLVTWIDDNQEPIRTWIPRT